MRREEVLEIIHQVGQVVRAKGSELFKEAGGSVADALKMKALLLRGMEEEKLDEDFFMGFILMIAGQICMEVEISDVQ